jgi:hypothetical protein
VPVVIVRGVGDIDSAVAHLPLPGGIRRGSSRRPAADDHAEGMAFADAVFDGQSTLDGVRAMQVDHMDEVRGRRLPNVRRSQSQPTGPSGL